MNPSLYHHGWWDCPPYRHSWPGQVENKATGKHAAARKRRAIARKR